MLTYRGGQVPGRPGEREKTIDMTWDIVGRDAELATLVELLRRPMPAPVTIVHGSAGIGKTRIVSELARQAREDGFCVLWGTAYDGGVAHPFGPWVELIGDHVQSLAPDALRAALGSDAAVLAQLAPTIRERLPDVPVATELVADDGRLRLYQAVTAFLNRLDEPALAVFDDLHLADAAALDLFVHVARSARRLRLLVTYRGDTLALAHPLGRALAEVQRQRRCEYLALAPLARDDAATLLATAAQRPLERDLIDAVYAESAGNAFFLSEFGRHLRDHVAPTLDDAGGWSVPQTIVGAIGLRLSPLTAATQRVLELAAVFSGGFSFGELAAMAGADEDVLLACLEDALGAELLRPLPGERYDFVHELVRHALLTRSSPSRRARLHRRLAEALERLHAADTAPVAAELARQYHASATLPGAERGVAHALVAARQALAVHAAADAIAILRNALDLVLDDDDAARAQVLGALALAQADAMQPDDAATTLATALDLMEASGAEPATVADVVYEVCSILAMSVSIPIRPLVARGLAALDERDERDELAWARLRLLERMAQPGDTRSARWLNLDTEAVRIVRARGTEADYAHTIDPTEPWAAGEASALLARLQTWHDPAARLRGLMMVTLRLALWAPDGTPEAERACRAFEQLAAEVGSPLSRAFAHVARGALLGARGEFAPAAKALEQGRAITREWASVSWIPAYAAFVDALTRQHVEPDWPRVASTIWELSTRSDQFASDRLTHAAFASYAFARMGSTSRSRAILGDILPALAAAGRNDTFLPDALHSAAATAWELRDAGAAAQLVGSIEHAVADSTGDPYMTSSELSLARLLVLLDRFDEAAEAFSRARTTLELRAQRPLRAIVDFDEATARAWRGQPGAERLRAAAQEQFTRLGMRAWEQRAARQAAAVTRPDGLTAREVEILRLLAEGNTNREIAARLVLSVHTVERHVHNAYRKIGAHNRAEATTYAIRVLD